MDLNYNLWYVIFDNIHSNREFTAIKLINSKFYKMANNYIEKEYVKYGGKNNRDAAKFGIVRKMVYNKKQYYTLFCHMIIHDFPDARAIILEAKKYIMKIITPHIKPQFILHYSSLCEAACEFTDFAARFKILNYCISIKFHAPVANMLGALITKANTDLVNYKKFLRLVCQFESTEREIGLH